MPPTTAASQQCKTVTLSIRCPKALYCPLEGIVISLMEEDYGLNASRVVLHRLQQNYFGNEFGWITPFILVVIKQGYALLLFEGMSSWPQTFGPVYSLITSLKASTASRDKIHSWRPCCSACTSLQLCVAVQIATAGTNPASADPEQTWPSSSLSFTSQVCLCVPCCLCTEPAHTNLPWPWFWIRKMIVF